MSGNLGLLYYRKEHGYGKEIEKITALAMPDRFAKGNLKPFMLKTLYPGLLIGTGYAHPVSEKVSDEMPEGYPKNGFYFDHTTGLPLIPGSSIKGALRSSFPSLHASDTKAMFGKKEYKEQRAEYIIDLLKHIPEPITLSSNDISALEREIFEGVGRDGTQLSSYKRDIFYDAYVVAPSSGKLLATDYITPHKNRKNLKFADGTRVPDEFCEPNPIKIIKIASEVTFAFEFRLHDGTISATQKQALFKQILLDRGVGAKTNVGYGAFVKVS